MDKNLNNTKRNEYVVQINRVIDYIEANLDEPLSLDILSDISGFSKFHFHRIFTAFTGETLNKFIQRIRVEKAACRLINNRDISVTDIAFDFGFSSSSSFARLFKETFNISASNYRKKYLRDSKICKTHSNIRKDFDISMFYIDPVKNNMKWRIIMKDKAKEINVEVKDLKDMHVAYVRHTGPYAGDSALFESLMEKLFTWAAPRGLMKEDTLVISAYHDNPDITAPENLRLSICITVPEETEVTGDIGKMKIDSGKYAVAHFELTSPEEYKKAWELVYAGWLPESGFKPADGINFEINRNDPRKHPQGLHLVDICIPVQPA